MYLWIQRVWCSCEKDYWMVFSVVSAVFQQYDRDERERQREGVNYVNYSVESIFFIIECKHSARVKTSDGPVDGWHGVVQGQTGISH